MWENERYVDADKTHVYSYSTTKPVLKEKIPAIKQAIEAILNNDKVGEVKNFGMFTPQQSSGTLYTQQQLDEAIKSTWLEARCLDEVDYRHIPYKHKNFITYKQSLASSSPEKKLAGCGICFGKCVGHNSVEQKPIQEETIEEFFKRHNVIGQPVTGGYHFIYNGKSCYGQVSVLPYHKLLAIKPCYIQDDIGKGAGQAVYMQFPQKPQDKPLPLFVTFDNVPIFEGGYFWIVDTDWSVYQPEPAHELSGRQIERKYFSTEEKAKEYVLMNKPCLSLKEILEHIPSNVFSNSVLISLAKQKINSI